MMSQIRSHIESTFKSRDTEETLDRLFYRPLGYGIALLSKSLGLTPNMVTFMSIVLGVAAGHLFWYQNVSVNLIGVILLVTAEALDSADGQLARMTNISSRYGRIFDGVASNFMFISIYLHLCARYVAEGGTPWIFLVAVISGFSHSFQSAMSDYYRIFYLYFNSGKNIGGIDDPDEMQIRYDGFTWTGDLFKKFLLRVYINYIVQQQLLAKSVRKIYDFVQEKFQGTVPEWLGDRYCELNKPFIKWGNILTTNTRMMVLFITIFAGNVLHYFLFELIVLNALLVYFVLMEERINARILAFAHEYDSTRSAQPDDPNVLSTTVDHIAGQA